MEQYLYERVLRAFYENNVKYLIVGGIALNLHGVPRATFDLDIVIAWDEENVKKIENVLRKLNFKPLVPLDLKELIDSNKRENIAKKKHMFAMNFYNTEDPLEEIDILIRFPDNIDELIKRRKTIKIDDFEIYLISLDDLIKLKRRSKRHKDKEDMKNLMLVKQIKKEKRNEN